MALIQFAIPVDETPCECLNSDIGLFFPTLQTQSEPLSPHDKNASSLMNFTQSTLPRLPLLKTSCDSSTIFHIRSVESHPPDVSARSLPSASIEVTGF